MQRFCSRTSRLIDGLVEPSTRILARPRLCSWATVPCTCSGVGAHTNGRDASHCSASVALPLAIGSAATELACARASTSIATQPGTACSVPIDGVPDHLVLVAFAAAAGLRGELACVGGTALPATSTARLCILLLSQADVRPSDRPTALIDLTASRRCAHIRISLFAGSETLQRFFFLSPPLPWAHAPRPPTSSPSIPIILFALRCRSYSLSTYIAFRHTDCRLVRGVPPPERFSRPALSVAGEGARAMSWCTFDIF